jgi:hypothetical protein
VSKARQAAREALGGQAAEDANRAHYLDSLRGNEMHSLGEALVAARTDAQQLQIARNVAKHVLRELDRLIGLTTERGNIPA